MPSMLGLRGADGPFVVVHFAAIPPSFVDLELFGSSSSRESVRVGRIAEAAGGTLYLEDIDRLPDSTRVRIEGMSRAGSLGARLVASRLAADAPSGDRAGSGITALHVAATISVPPLRLRGQDLLRLFQHHLDRSAVRFATPPPALSDAEIREIMLYDWAGNVAELRAQAERFALGMGLAIGDLARNPAAADPLPEQVAAFERSAIVRELRRAGGSIKATYMALGIHRKTLQDKMRKYGLRRNDSAADR